MAIRFGELKKYFSRVVRLSICFHDGHYDNYILPTDIPAGEYDDLYVYGVGTVDVEFPLDVYVEHNEKSKSGWYLGCGLEVVVQENARDIERCNNEELTFGDLRNYLQCGRNFSIVTKEQWEEEIYEWRHEIPEKYNDMYVYGIGLEYNMDALHEEKRINFIDSQLMKNLRIVLSETPRK